jgi:hypothetical protein
VYKNLLLVDGLSGGIVGNLGQNISNCSWLVYTDQLHCGTTYVDINSYICCCMRISRGKIVSDLSYSFRVLMDRDIKFSKKIVVKYSKGNEERREQAASLKGRR